MVFFVRIYTEEDLSPLINSYTAATVHCAEAAVLTSGAGPNWLAGLSFSAFWIVPTVLEVTVERTSRVPRTGGENGVIKADASGRAFHVVAGIHGGVQQPNYARRRTMTLQD